MEEYFVSAFREDKFYANADFYMYSTVPLDGYNLWSTFLSQKYKGYDMDPKTFKILRSPTTEALRFDELMGLFTRKDFTAEESQRFEEKLQENNGSMFLDESVPVPKILLTPYMRSGNALTRKYFESITGIATGSAMPNKYIIDFSTQVSGFKGDSYWNSDNIWMYKSHHPFTMHSI